MTAYSHLTQAFFKSQLREPIGFFFVIVFSPMLLLILGGIFGNDPQPQFGGRGFVDNMLPGVTIMSILMVGIALVPQNQLMLRSTGALSRLRVTPLKASTYVAADLTVNFVLGFVGAILTLVVGLVVFRVSMPQHLMLLIASLVFGLVTMLAIGYTLAAVYPSVAAANGISNGLLIILIMSSGVFFPTEGLSAGVRTAMACSPVHHITELVRAAWTGTSLPMVSVLVLIGFTVVFGLLSTVLFRWDKTA